MKKSTVVIIVCIFIFLAIVSGYLWYGPFQGAKPAVLPSPGDIVDELDDRENLPPGENKTGFPLSLPDGFRIQIFAKNLPGARVMAFDDRGNMWVSRTKQGVVTMLDIDENGVTTHDIFKGLKSPHGLAFDLKNWNRLYIAEENRISYAEVYNPNVSQTLRDSGNPSDYESVNLSLAVSSQMLPASLVDLPAGGRHVTRTLFWAGDNQLYISIGSTCDVCDEKDPRNAGIMRVNLEERKLEPYANGLRNSVFAATHLVTGDMWATEMGRDFLGDNLPPDEVNIIHKGKNYGWPLCYGQKVHDTQFDTRQYVRDPCEDTEGSYIDLPAHVAPLGLGFIPEEGWPEEYWYDLLIAVHGSWNRSEPIGYKVVRIALDANGKPEHLDADGKPLIEDFISGWLTDGDRALGRPVDLLIQPGGVIYISDDKAGVIYKVNYNSEPEERDRADLIRVTSPQADTKVASPLRIEGEARGIWYFEASFPIRILDDKGNEIGAGHAKAQSDWMTEEFVPFVANVSFTVPQGVTRGTLVLQKDNPSGLPEHDDEIRIPVTF